MKRFSVHHMEITFWYMFYLHHHSSSYFTVVCLELTPLYVFISCHGRDLEAVGIYFFFLRQASIRRQVSTNSTGAHNMYIYTVNISVLKN